MFKTWLTETLGIKYPIIQGAMLWLSRAELASAVSNAGGLGIINAGSFSSTREFREEIIKMKSLTDKPFAINITLMPTRRPINWEEYIITAIEEGINIVETSGRSPKPFMPLLKEAKIKVMHKAARIRDAKTAERIGVDAVTITGFEAGGHPGMEDVTSLILIPRTVDSVKIPVIAAGGFGDGRGLVAALVLGAQGILMGTRFMASRECPLHPKIKNLIMQTGETDTMIIERSTKNASRVIKTDFAWKVLAMEEKGATLEELFPLITGKRAKNIYTNGDINDSILFCGQVAGQVNDTPTAMELIKGIVDEAEQVMEGLKEMGTAIQ